MHCLVIWNAGWMDGWMCFNYPKLGNPAVAAPKTTNKTNYTTITRKNPLVNSNRIKEQDQDGQRYGYSFKKGMQSLALTQY